MATNFLGEIRMFAGNFAPAGWAICDGSLLAITGNIALFSLLGVAYGGDGVSTFALPDLRGRVPVCAGTTFPFGAALGSEQAVLTNAQLPAHSHPRHVAAAAPSPTLGPGGSLLSNNAPIYANASSAVPMSPLLVSQTGGGQGHENMAPFLAINFIIAVVGIFPSRA